MKFLYAFVFYLLPFAFFGQESVSFYFENNKSALNQVELTKLNKWISANQKSKCTYAYHEIDGIGYISKIEDPSQTILSHYPEYRDEQTKNGKTKYWKDMWYAREIYAM